MQHNCQHKTHKFKMSFALLLATLATVVSADIARYDGYKVYKVSPLNDVQALLIKALEDNDAYDFLSGPRRAGHDSTVIVTPNEQENFKSILNHYEIPYKKLTENVEDTIQNERRSQRVKSENETISFQKYNTVSEIEEYLKYLEKKYPDIVTLNKIGSTYEKQPLYVLKISKGGTSKKPIILIDAGIHAREWIAPAVALYIIHQLVENQDNRNLIESIDWHIIPILNPDGYKYSHEAERFWRKTRSKGVHCYGVDANRNFDFHWMEIGASSKECAQDYAGPEPFSESEAKALRDYILLLSNQTKLYVTFHSYGKYILYPWGFTTEPPNDADVLDALGRRVATAIAAVNGSHYHVGGSASILYAAAGGSDDYVKGVGGVALSYTIELPGDGEGGFVLPPSRILPVVKETFEGMREFHAYIKANYASS